MNSSSSLRANRGSVLIVALILALVIAVALGSYISMSTTALNFSQRSFLSNQAMNVAEAGLEQALWAVNQQADENPNAWSYFNTPVGTEITGTFTNFTLSQNVTAAVKVYVKNYNSDGDPAPIVVAQGTVTPTLGSPITKMVEVHLGKRSADGGAIITKEGGVVLKGSRVTIDSWDDDPDNNPATSSVAYINSTPQANALVATPSISATIDVQNAKIYGRVSVGSDSTTAIDIGPNGVIGDTNAALGTIDEERVASNFTMNIPDETNPDVVSLNNDYQGGMISGEISLPLAGATGVEKDGKTVYYYTAAAIEQGGNESNILTIKDGYHVVIILSAASGTTAVKTVGADPRISIGDDASLALYTEGDVSISGGSLVNSNNDAASFEIHGTNTTPGVQSIDIGGNGELKAVVRAPNAEVTIRGTADVYGSIVAYKATLEGEIRFHYPESLLLEGDKYFQVRKWVELLSAADRAKYATQLNF